MPKPQSIEPASVGAGEKVLARTNELEAQLEARLDAKLGPGAREQLLALLERSIARNQLGTV